LYRYGEKEGRELNLSHPLEKGNKICFDLIRQMAATSTVQEATSFRAHGRGVQG